MKYRIAQDARPQVRLLMAATLLSFALWVISWFLPAVGYIVYPLQLFATFIHEGAHVLAAILTDSSVQSLTVSYDASGEVYSRGSGWLSQLFISSAGYLGTTAFGAALLAWMRFGYSSRLALYISAGLVGVLTVVFGVLAPIWNFLQNVTVGTVLFTVFSGIVISSGLAVIARFARARWVNLTLAFVAVQALLNAVFSLFELFLISTFTGIQSDAANMAAATGLPAVVWVVLWIGISLLMISVGLRIYAVNRQSSTGGTVFED